MLPKTINMVGNQGCGTDQPTSCHSSIRILCIKAFGFPLRKCFLSGIPHLVLKILFRRVDAERSQFTNRDQICAFESVGLTANDRRCGRKQRVPGALRGSAEEQVDDRCEYAGEQVSIGEGVDSTRVDRHAENGMSVSIDALLECLGVEQIEQLGDGCTGS